MMDRPAHRTRVPDRTGIRAALIALNAAPDLSRGSICRLAHDGLDALLDPSRAPDARRLGVTEKDLLTARARLEAPEAVADRETEKATRHGASLVTVLDPSYPAPLRDLFLPPPVLYVRGSIPTGPAVAMVGSRRASEYGLEAARFFARHLGDAGATVVSGFARGVDAASHRGALQGRGETVAVLGCGIDYRYPSHHGSLGGRIAARGALVSEFPMGRPPRRRSFPVRNRIIAALGAATIVVQATPRSGSLITARHAIELGREVFAVPGRIFDDRSLGTNALIRDGAGPALHPSDIAAAVGIDDRAGISTDEEPPPLGAEASRIWQALRPHAFRSPDRLAGETDLPVSKVVTLLLELELEGWVVRKPGPRYRRGSR